MSKIILLLSIFVSVVIYSGVYAECPGGWCHPVKGYGCCEGNQCTEWLSQGVCITHAEAKLQRTFMLGK